MEHPSLGSILSPNCDCAECTDIDWDAPCINCNWGSIAGRPQRDCCGCHDPDCVCDSQLGGII